MRPTPKTTGTSTRRATPTAPPTAPTTWSAWGRPWRRCSAARASQVIHDTNLYDYPAYNGSYDRSKAAVRDWLAKYPTIRIILDVHRDALVGATAPSISWSPRRMGKRPPRSCWWWAPTAAGRSTRTGSTIWPWPSGSSQELVSDYVSLARPIVLRNSSYNPAAIARLPAGGGGGAREYPHRGGGRSPPLCPERQPGAEHHVGEIAQENDRSRTLLQSARDLSLKKRIKMKRTCLLQVLSYQRVVTKGTKKYYITFKFSRDGTAVLL